MKNQNQKLRKLTYKKIVGNKSGLNIFLTLLLIFSFQNTMAANPSVTSATYNASTGELVVTGADFVAKTGTDNDVDVDKIAIRGQANNYQPLTSSDIEITSSTSFSITLNSIDKQNINGLLNKNGTQSGDGTNYDLIAYDNWMTETDEAIDISDLSGNSITASNVSTPTITSANYDFQTGVLVVTGVNLSKKFGASNDIDVSKLTILGDGADEYTLTSSDVEISSETNFTVNLSTTDRLNVNGLLNIDGTDSWANDPFLLKASDDWLTSSDINANIADLSGNSINATNAKIPTIVASSYNASTGVLSVTGTYFRHKVGLNNDIDISKFIITGEGAQTYTLTTTSIEIASETDFSVTLDSTDKDNVNQLLNKNGTSSSGSQIYNLNASANWATGIAIQAVDATNPITVSNVATPQITSATYNETTRKLIVTGTGFTSAGPSSDIDVGKLTITGQAGASLTLSNSPDVNIDSYTQFSVTLSSADSISILAILDKKGTQSTDNSTYSLSAAEDWARGPESSANIVDNFATLNFLDLLTPTVSINKGLSTYSGNKKIINIDSLRSTDEDTHDDNLIYTINTAPTYGRIERLGSLTSSFTQKELSYGWIKYAHSGSSTTSDSFTFTISDGVNSLSSQTFSISVSEAVPMTLKFNTELSAGTTIELPLTWLTDSTLVDWGDGGAIQKITTAGATSHTYASEGQYTVNILHGLHTFGSSSGWTGAEKLTQVTSFGTLPLISLSGAFYEAINLTEVPQNLPTTITNLSKAFHGTASSNFTNLDLWNTANVNNFSQLFESSPNFNQDIGSWNTSNATTLYRTFSEATSFNQNINSWDVSKVETMYQTFYGADSFNLPLNNWDVSQVTHMNHMFSGASSFNQPLNSWNVAKVESMVYMFSDATSFNQPLDSWNVAEVTTMQSMFRNASSFNQTLNSWNVGKVTTMNSMFERASIFNHTLDSWDVSKVSNMSRMFYSADSFNSAIGSWTTTSLDSAKQMFMGSNNFNQNIDSWNVSQVRDMTQMFYSADSFNQPLNSWSVGNVTQMSYMFSGAIKFNQPLNSWDVSNVTDMKAMFANATAFNQPLNSWNVGKVTDMNSMFSQATAFDQPLSSWDVSKVTTTAYMFSNAYSFNSSLSGWVTTSLDSMNRMFNYAKKFNQNIDSWDVSNVTTMEYTFSVAESFNQPLNSWNVSNVKVMSNMFSSAKAFNQSLNAWNVSKVTHMNSMFSNASIFNGNISSWNTQEVIDMNRMFLADTIFNQDLSGWNVSKVNNFYAMFQWSDQFNQDISSWNTGSATDMRYMFSSADSFSQDLSNWDIADVTALDYFHPNPMSVEIYDSLLIKWATQAVQSNLSLGVSSSQKYSPLANSARNFLVNTKGWTINDGGELNVAPTIEILIADTTVLEDFNQFDYKDLNLIFSDLNNDPLTFSVISTTNKITPSIRASDSMLVLTSISNLNGVDSLIISASDGNITTSDTIIIQITPVNDPAVVTKADSLFFPKNSKTLLSVAMTDAVHPDGLNMSLIALPGTHYTLSGDTLIPNTDYTGPLSIALRITDGIDTSASITMSATVKDAMVLEFNTSLIADSTVRIPVQSLNGVTVFWGDGDFYHGTPDGSSDKKVEHVYTDNKTYTVTIVGTAERFGHSYSQVSKLDALVKVNSLGDLNLNSLEYGFYNTPFLESVPNELPTTITSLAYTFYKTGQPNIVGLENWDISNVTDLEGTFYAAKNFNSDISNWNTSNVTTLESTFEDAHSFNQDIGSWNTSKVTNLYGTFYADSAFNQDLSSWDVSKVEDFDYLFGAATSFNQDLNSWNTTAAVTMESVFYGAISFNGKVSNWNLSSVESIDGIFWEAKSFNQDLSTWNVSNITDMDYAFGYASTFNQDLSNWDVSKVTDMDELFSYAHAFNGNITTWNVSKVEDFEETFYGATSFNQDISSWDVSSATEMDYMFDSATVFNQDISNWNVANVEDMEGMFMYAKTFDQDISSWDVSKVRYLDDMFLENKMTTDIYDSSLIKWAQLSVDSNLTFHAGTSTHSPISQAAKDFLINTKGWTIIDGGSADLQKVGILNDTTLNEDFESLDYTDLNNLYQDYQGHNITFSVNSTSLLTSPTIRSSDSMLVLNSKLDLNGVDTLIISATDGVVTLIDSIIINITPVNDTSFTIDSTYAHFQDTIKTVDSVYSSQSDTLVTHLTLERVYDTTFIKLDSLIESGSFAVHIDTISQLVINTLDSTVDTLVYIPTLTTSSSLTQSNTKDTITVVDSVYSDQSDTVITTTITEYLRDTTFTQTDSLSDGVIYGSKVDTLASLDSTLISTTIDTLKQEVIVSVMSLLNSIDISYSAQALISSQVILGSSQWIIFDTQGREVRARKFLNSTRKWQLQKALKTGSYILIISQENRVFSEPFTIK